MLTGITFFRSTEPDIFRRTRCTVKTAAKNIAVTAQLPTIMLGAGAPGRRFSRLAKDGARKNDAATRLLEDVRREHPHLKLVEDGLAGPHLLKGLDLRLGAKPGDHKFLFEWVNSAPSVEHREFTDENDIRLRYGVPLNDTHPRSQLSLGETPKRQETTLGYGSANQRGEAVDAHRTGALEGTKLTLKNQGYCFEHNHGKKNLSTVFALMLAFLLNGDVASWQAQMEARRSSYFREKVRGLFLNYFLKDWETLCVRASGGNSLRYILNHRGDQVCRSRFFRGNRIVKAMSAPGRSGRGGSRWLALWQRCGLDAPSANVGPLAGIAGSQPLFLPCIPCLMPFFLRRRNAAFPALPAIPPHYPARGFG